MQGLDASVPAIEPAQTATTESQIVALSTAEWPRIPTQWRKRTGERSPGSDAGPTGAPWVDSNGWKCLLAAAKAPGKTIWTLAEPPEDVTGYRPPHYALAVADSAVYGGQWVVAFDAETRKALASGVARRILECRHRRDAVLRRSASTGSNSRRRRDSASCRISADPISFFPMKL